MPENTENDPTNQGQSYAERLQALADAQRASFLYIARGGSNSYKAGEGAVQRLPLSVNIDGAPMDVLFTVSVGSSKSPDGRYKPVSPPYPNSTQNAVTMAAQNFAIVRKPYSSEQPWLVALTTQEIEAGQCDLDRTSQEQSERTASPIPGPQQDALRLEVPVSEDPNQSPATLLFQTGHNEGSLIFTRGGQPSTYAMIAAQV